MSKLLLDEQPLVILPKLAVAIGLNEAIVLQQLHYWVERSKNEKNGKYWVYNSIGEWKDQFPFWSKNTIIRTFDRLEEKNLVETGTFNKIKSDRTKWYTINYDTLNAHSEAFTQNGQMEKPKMGRPTTQNGQMDNPKRVNDTSTQNGQMVNQRETTSKTTTTGVVVDPAFADVSNFYQSNFGVLNGFMAQQLMYELESVGSELVIEAMKIALKNNKRNWKYVEGILDNWKKNNVKTVSDVKALDTERKAKNEQAASLSTPSQQLYIHDMTAGEEL